MPKRLVVSPEVLVLGASHGQAEGIARAIRRMVDMHGQMPMVIGCTEHLGEVYVEDELPKRGRVVLDRVRFTADHV